MSDHGKAKSLIEKAYKMTGIEDEPSASEWLDLVVSLAAQLEHYVWLREESES